MKDTRRGNSQRTTWKLKHVGSSSGQSAAQQEKAEGCDPSHRSISEPIQAGARSQPRLFELQPGRARGLVLARGRPEAHAADIRRWPSQTGCGVGPWATGIRRWPTTPEGPGSNTSIGTYL